MQVQPYLFFDGRGDEMLDFYKRAIGAEVTMLMRFKDSPEPSDPEKCGGMTPAGDKIMHAAIRIGDTVIFGSDGQCSGKPSFQGFAFSLTVKDEAQADRFFNALADGGRIEMPLDKTFFSPRFGMLADRFGVFWMVMVDKQ